MVHGPRRSKMLQNGPNRVQHCHISPPRSAGTCLSFICVNIMITYDHIFIWSSICLNSSSFESRNPVSRCLKKKSTHLPILRLVFLLSGNLQAPRLLRMFLIISTMIIPLSFHDHSIIIPLSFHDLCSKNKTDKT